MFSFVEKHGTLIYLLWYACAACVFDFFFFKPVWIFVLAWVTLAYGLCFPFCLWVLWVLVVFMGKAFFFYYFGLYNLSFIYSKKNMMIY